MRFTAEQRKKIIARIVRSVDSWDLDTLVSYCKESLEESVQTFSDQTLAWEFEKAVGCTLAEEYREFDFTGEFDHKEEK